MKYKKHLETETDKRACKNECAVGTSTTKYREVTCKTCKNTYEYIWLKTMSN